MKLQTCYELDNLIGIPFTPADREELEKLIRKAGNATELVDTLVSLAEFVETTNVPTK